MSHTQDELCENHTQVRVIRLRAIIHMSGKIQHKMDIRNSKPTKNTISEKNPCFQYHILQTIKLAL